MQPPRRIEPVVRMVAGVSVGLLVACLDAPPRVCERDDECRLEGRQGVCESDGYCAYRSDECPSGARYGPFAAEQADTCTPDCTEVSPTLPCDDDPSCPVACRQGDPVLVATWAHPSSIVEPRHVAAGADGLVAVTGTLANGPLALLMRDDGSVIVDDPTPWLSPQIDGRAVAIAPSGTVWLAGDTGSEDVEGPTRVVVIRLEATGVPQGGFGVGTTGEQRVLALGADDTGAVTVAGLLDGAAWLERRGSDDALSWSERRDDGFEPVDMAVSPGGRAGLVGVWEDGSVGLQIFDPGGALAVDVELVLGLMRLPGALDVSGAGTVVVSESGQAPWVAATDPAGALRWVVEPDGVQDLVDGALDGRGRATLVGTTTAGGITAAWIQQLDGEGEPRWTRRLPSDEGWPVAVTLDAQERPVVLGVVPSGLGLWVRRFDP
ncbi:MAG: hypothetical protein AAGF11_12870 [Myxococcota bacterium]